MDCAGIHYGFISCYNHITQQDIRPTTGLGQEDTTSKRQASNLQAVWIPVWTNSLSEAAASSHSKQAQHSFFSMPEKWFHNQNVAVTVVTQHCSPVTCSGESSPAMYLISTFMITSSLIHPVRYCQARRMNCNYFAGTQSRYFNLVGTILFDFLPHYCVLHFQWKYNRMLRLSSAHQINRGVTVRTLFISCGGWFCVCFGLVGLVVLVFGLGFSSVWLGGGSVWFLVCFIVFCLFCCGIFLVGFFAIWFGLGFVCF